MKRTLLAVIALIILVCMATVSAAPAGSTTDPLITLAYINGGYAESLRTGISGTLGNAADNAIGTLDEIYKDYIGYSFAPRFTRISIAAGDSVDLTFGSSFILLVGTAKLTITGGPVINVTTGNEVIADSPLILNQRYFCAENTTARVTAGSALTGQVDGYYYSSGDAHVIPQLPFSDVSETDWFFTAVSFVYKNNLFQGTSAKTFSPGVPMTRAMFVTVLHRLDRLPEAGTGGGFSDVSNPAEYYYNAVTWANANSIVTGYDDGTFRPNTSVTREQMATIMHRYAAYKGRDMSSTDVILNVFPDKDLIAGYAAEPVRWAVSWGVINGSDGRLLPRNSATRAQVAQIIYNYCEKIGR